MYIFIQINKKNIESTLPMLIISTLLVFIPIRNNTIPSISPSMTNIKHIKSPCFYKYCIK